MDVSLAPKRDGRVVASAAICLVFAAIGLMSGRAELMAVAAAVAAPALVSSRLARPLTVAMTAEVQNPQVIEGDSLDTVVRLRVPTTHDVSVDVLQHERRPGPMTIEVVRLAGDEVELHVHLDTTDWGRFDLGDVVVRAVAPGGMYHWQQRIGSAGMATVLPRAERLDTLLGPRATQISSGRHLSTRVIGDGTDFADIAEYTPGDRFRDINWKVSGRQGVVHVNRHHPPRGGDVVIVLDAVPDGWRHSPIGSLLLQGAGRSAWAIARHHLAAQDRVGLMVQQAQGVDWLPPSGGRRAQYRVLERVLQSASPWQHDGDRRALDRGDIPPSALVVGISSLASDEMLLSLAALRTHGREVAVLAIDARDATRRLTDLDRATARLAHLVFDARVTYLRRLSTPVVVWDPRDDIDRSLATLDRLTRRQMAMRSAP